MMKNETFILMRRCKNLCTFSVNPDFLQQGVTGDTQTIDDRDETLSTWLPLTKEVLDGECRHLMTCM